MSAADDRDTLVMLSGAVGVGLFAAFAAFSVSDLWMVESAPIGR